MTDITDLSYISARGLIKNADLSRLQFVERQRQRELTMEIVRGVIQHEFFLHDSTAGWR